jgi:hypothetical protein
MRSDWRELARKDLELGRFTITHLPTSDTYKLVRGEVSVDPGGPVTAYFVDENGSPTFLERSR